MHSWIVCIAYNLMELNMKPSITSIVSVCFFLFSQCCFISHGLAADTLETFTNPLGSSWGVLNPEPDQATAIARAGDDFIISGYVPYIDPDPYHYGDEKGGYGIFYKLDEAGYRVFYRSFVDETNFHCQPGTCVTCGSPDVSDYTSHVSLYSNHNQAWGRCTMVRDVAVSPTPGGEEYVLLGSRLTRIVQNETHYMPGLWLAKTNTDGILTLDLGHADHFPQQLDEGSPLDPYYSFGTSLTPIRDSDTGSYDFLIGANIDHNTAWFGWLLRTNNAGTIKWEEGESTNPGLWFSARRYPTTPPLPSLGGHGMTEVFETDTGYVVTSDGGVWGLDSSRNLSWEYDEGVHGYRSMVKEGTDTVVVTSLEIGGENYPALVKVDSTGSFLWSTDFDLTENQCELVKVVRTDYGYVAVGSITTKGYGGLDVWLAATDVYGNRLWDKTLGGEFNDKGVDLLFIPGATPEDDDALVVAATASFDTDDINGPEAHAWVVKTRDRFYPPVADFTWAPEPVVVEQEISFTATANKPIERYDWDFGDGTQIIDGNQSEPHTYADYGDYEIMLSVWDNDGVQTIVKKTITVNFFTVQWERVFDLSRYREGNIESDFMTGRGMVQTPDNGFAVTGFSSLWNDEYTHSHTPILIKTDDRGMFVWQQNFEGFGYNPDHWIQGAGEAIALDQNNDIIITGYVNSHYLNNTSRDLWVVKTDPDGTPRWDLVIDNGFKDSGNDIAVMDDGYFIAGSRNDTSESPYDDQGWLVKIDNDGTYNEAESKIFDSPNDPDHPHPRHFTAIKRVDNNTGLLLTGGMTNSNSGYSDGYDPVPLVHTNNSGVIDWSIRWPESAPYALTNYLGHWVDQADDGNYLVAGAQYDQPFITKTAIEGSTPSIVWETKIPCGDPSSAGHWNRIWAGVKTEDGGYLMAATLRAPEHYTYADWALFKFNAVGEELWRWVPNEGPDDYSHEEPRAIISHGRGNYTILLNRGDFLWNRSSEFVLIKIGPGQDPVAAFEADQTSGSLPLGVNFTDMSSNGTVPYEYTWDFGDGETSNDQNPVHTYFVTGQYTVTLTITDSSDREDTYVRNLYITAGTPALAGDIDADGDVDGHDLYLLQQAMNSEPGDDNWNPNADLNGDGVINAADIDLFAGYFGD